MNFVFGFMNFGGRSKITFKRSKDQGSLRASKGGRSAAMERSRRGGVSRAEQAKAKLAALVAQKETGKKRAETFEVEKEEALYDEARSQPAFPDARSAAACCTPRRAGATITENPCCAPPA